MQSGNGDKETVHVDPYCSCLSVTVEFFYVAIRVYCSLRSWLAHVKSYFKLLFSILSEKTSHFHTFHKPVRVT